MCANLCVLTPLALAPVIYGTIHQLAAITVFSLLLALTDFLLLVEVGFQMFLSTSEVIPEKS